LDILRQAHSAEAERLLEAMDEIYGLLVTVDYPDAITGNLRRTTDLVRGLVERTRGDLTTSLQQDSLRAALDSVEKKLGPRAGDGEA
jgi:translin